MRRFAVLLVLLSVASLASVASATPRGEGGREARSPRAHRSRSIGLAWRGRLARGVKLRESARVRYIGEYAEAGNHWGTWQLVQLLERWLQRREVQPQVALHGTRPERCGELGGLGVVWRDRVPRPSVGLGHGDEARLLAALHVTVPDLGVVLDVLVALCASVARTLCHQWMLSTAVQPSVPDSAARRGGS